MHAHIYIYIYINVHIQAYPCITIILSILICNGYLSLPGKYTFQSCTVQTTSLSSSNPGTRKTRRTRTNTG